MAQRITKSRETTMDISEEARLTAGAICADSFRVEEIAIMIQVAIDKSNAKLREKIEFTPRNPAAEALRDQVARWPKENLEAMHGRVTEM